MGGKETKSSKTISVLTIILLLTCIPLFTEVVNAVSCEQCESYYYLFKGYGYTTYELKEVLREYGCDGCPNMRFLYGSSTYSSSDTDNTCCLMGGIGIIILLIIGLIYVFLPKKDNNKSTSQGNNRSCPNCGRRNIPFDAITCPYCAKSFDTNMEIDKDKPEENTTSTYCTSCGTENTTEGKFCIECGSKL